MLHHFGIGSDDHAKKFDNTTDSESTVVHTSASSIVFRQKKLNIVVSAEKW